MKSLIMIALTGLAAAAAAVAQTPLPTPAPTSAPTSAPTPGFEAPRRTARQRPCLNPDEARGLATFVLPGLIEGVAQRCRGSLARDAYLRRPDADMLSSRLRADAVPVWPLARGAIEKLNGARLPTLFGDRFVRNAAEGVAADLVLREFDRADCGAVDGLVASLAPLPSANMSNAVAALIALGGTRAGDDAPLRICSAPPPR